MNGNISKEGIEKDLAWMHDVGLGGVQAFDANLQTPQIVDHRLVYMTPEWKDAFRLAVKDADRLGLEFGIASSPGWSETGGPWVPPEDGLKKLVWTMTSLAPGRHFTGVLAAPPSVTGPYGDVGKLPGIDEMLGGKAPPVPRYYADIAVLAVPMTASAQLARPEARDGAGNRIDAALLYDPGGKGANLARVEGQAPALTLSWPGTQTVRSASLFVPGAASLFSGPAFLPGLEASDDGVTWRRIGDMPLADVPTTIGFPAVTAKAFRIVFAPSPHAGPALGAAAPGAAMADMFANLGGAAAGKPVHVAQFTLSPETRVDRFEAKAGFAIVPDYYALSDTKDGEQGAAPGRTIDITSRMKNDGSLDWTPPKLPKGQEWRVVRFGWSLLGTTNHPATAEATGLEVDKFDGSAVHRYMDHYLAMYRDAAGADELGKQGVRAFLTDSIEVGAANWTPRMIADFKRLRGYDPTPFLPALTGILVGSRADSDRFLYDYRRTLADLMASEHYGTVDRDARAAGLTVYGEALEDHRPSLGDDMAMRSHTDVPMSAMWTFPRGGQPRASYLADTKGASSIAHIWGQNLAAAESMTSMLTPWADSPQTLKHVIDLEFLQGINRPVIHESTHQPVDDKVPGLSLSIFGQYFNRLDTWAPLARPWIDYIARNALLLQQGHDAADVGYFYGEEAPLTGLYGDKPVADASKTHAYDFVNAAALMGALANDGTDLVTPGGARYKVLYLGGSSAHMTLAALKRLAALVDGGATVIGLAPSGSPSEADADPASRDEYAALVKRLWPGVAMAVVGQGRVLAGNDVEAAMASMGVAPDFTFTGGGQDAKIPFVHRHLADGEDYFLVNKQEQTETIEAHFHVAGKAPELWHAETGEVESVSYRIANGETIMPLTLAPEESVHVMFRKPAVADAAAVNKPALVPAATLVGAWQVAFQPGRGAPVSAVLPELAPLQQNADPDIKYFSGIATYTKMFAAPKGWKVGRPLWLDLGDVRELAEVWVNGHRVGTTWHAPFRLDVGSAAHSGHNLLEVKVADLWVNRLIGDAQLGVTRKITWTALPTYRADTPLRPSGLIGPVTLAVEAK